MRSLTAESSGAARPAGAAPAGGAPRRRALRRDAFERAVRLDGEDTRDLLGVERLALQEGPGQAVELLDVLLEDVRAPGSRSRGRCA